MASAGGAIPPPLFPVEAPDRIASLDALRGVALLGILLVNIFSFAQPGYANPAAYGDLHGANFAVSRVGQFGIMLAIWCFQLALSTLWFRFFRMGPLESAWRSLTYWKPQWPRLRRSIPMLNWRFA